MASADISPGFYTLEIDKTKWEVRKKYQLVQPLGVGAYGHVVSFLDTSENVTRAIKKLMRPFLSTIHAKRTYRELRLLKHMHHENVISLLDVFTPQTSLETLEDVYLVTNLMGKDLNNIVKTQKLTDDHVQFMMYQILRGLKYIHSAGILHKILDFGLAQHEVGEVTGYVPTRWYKAPEIAFNWMSYSQTEDIWSAGCIMAELMTGKTLFPGSDDMDQLLRTLNLRGTPFSKIIDKIENAKAKDQIASLPIMEKKPLKEIFIGANPKALDLLDLMLDLDAEQRVNAEAALAHPYLEHYADSNDEPTAEKFDETFENLEMEISEWKKLVYDEVQSFKHVTPASDD